MYLSDVVLLRSTPFKDCRLYDVESFHLSCLCDPFDPRQNYIGILIYQINGHADIMVNSRHIKAGYIYIKKVQNIQNFGLSTHHANCMKSLLGDDYGQPVIASGFAYQNEQWKCNSSTYNESFIRQALANEWKPEYGEKIRELGNYEKCALSRMLQTYYMNNRFPSNMNIGKYSEVKQNNLFT